jgi:dephospho-CoA kinase
MERVMQRPSMTIEKVTAILARQLLDAEKLARADVVINTGGTWEETQAAIGRFIESLDTQTGGAFEKWQQRFGEPLTA